MEPETTARILVVDDDDHRRQMAAHLLHSAGHQVIEATTGSDGLRLARESPPDLVLLDRALPDADGAEICRAIKSDRKLDHVLVVLMSAIETSGDDQASGLEWGADGYIMLPISDRELLARVAALARIKKAEDALREGQEQYHSLFTNNHAVMLVIDPDDGTIVDANPAATAYYGWTQEEMRQKKIGQINTLPLEEVQAEMARAHREQRNHFFFQHRLSDGSVRDVEVFSGPITLQARSLLYSIIHDVTERKRTEEALRVSEERFRVAFHTSPDAININRLADGVFVEINEGFTALTGFTRQDVIGKSSLDIQIWCDPADRQKLIQGLREKGYYENLEARFRRKNGDVGIGLMSAKTILLQGVPHILSITRDISERKQAEEALRLSEEQYRSFFENTAAAVAILDQNGHVASANDADCRFLGYPHSELIGMHVARFTHPEDIALDTDLYQSLIAGQKQSYEVEKRYIRKDGEIVWGRMAVSLIRDSQGLPLYTSVVCVDITDRKRAEVQLNEQLDELRRWHTATLGREMRILDLKREVNDLLRRLDEPIRYPSVETEDPTPQKLQDPKSPKEME
jgi:PAS domain S-box-containing protein